MHDKSLAHKPQWGGKRHGAGRKAAKTALTEALAVIEEFRREVRSGAIGGVYALARKFPDLIKDELAEATDQNIPRYDRKQSRQFLIDKFLKFLQPDILIAQDSGTSPIDTFLAKLKEQFEVIDVTPSVEQLRNSNDKNFGVLGQDGTDDTEGDVRCPEVQASDGGGENRQEL